MSNSQLPQIHVMDFEGTIRSGVLEWGVVTLGAGRLQESSTGLCAPTGPCGARELALAGLKMEQLQGNPRFEAEWTRFSGLRQSGIFAAHHASVEDGLLKSVWPYPPASPAWNAQGHEVAAWGPWLDTRRLFERIFPSLESYKLGELLARFELLPLVQQEAAGRCPKERGVFHCALYDAIGAAVLLQYLLQLPGFGEASAEWLLAESAGSETTRKARKQQRL